MGKPQIKLRTLLLATIVMPPVIAAMFFMVFTGVRYVPHRVAASAPATSKPATNQPTTGQPANNATNIYWPGTGKWIARSEEPLTFASRAPIPWRWLWVPAVIVLTAAGYKLWRFRHCASSGRTAVNFHCPQAHDGEVPEWTLPSRYDLKTLLLAAAVVPPYVYLSTKLLGPNGYGRPLWWTWLLVTLAAATLVLFREARGYLVAYQRYIATYTLARRLVISAEREQRDK